MNLYSKKLPHNKRNLRKGIKSSRISLFHSNRMICVKTTQNVKIFLFLRWTNSSNNGRGKTKPKRAKLCANNAVSRETTGKIQIIAMLLLKVNIHIDRDINADS